MASEWGEHAMLTLALTGFLLWCAAVVLVLAFRRP
jgi:hypothetical protein